MKLNSVIKFEILYNAKKIYTYLFFAILIFQGVWYTIGVNDLFDNNNIHLNAPVIIYQNLSLMGLLLFAITAIISSGALARDLEFKTADTLYTMIVHEKRYFCSKYIGVVLVNLAVVIGYPLGMLLFPWMGIGSSEQFGPAPLGQLFHAFLLFTVPNLIFLVTFAVFLVVIFRKASAAYIGILLVLIFFLVSASVRDDSFFSLIIELLDPFGYCSVVNITDKMDVLELNNAYLPITNSLLANRLIWGVVSVLLFSITFWKFSFKTFIAQPSKKVKDIQNIDRASVSNQSHAIPAFRDYSIKRHLLKSVRFAWLDLKNIFKSPIFFSIMTTLFMMFIGYNFLWTSEYYITTSHLPLTSAMTFIRIPMMIVISILILILSGEFLFKERTSGVWQIVDAMPTPSWVFIVSKFLTLGTIAFIISSLIFVAGVFSQLVMGFLDIEWNLYIKELYGSRFGWITSLHMISLAFFCGAFFNSRLKGHIFSISILVFIVMSLDFKLIEQVRFAFPFVPAIFSPEKYNYSEMNGYGVLATGLPWYVGAWSALAALFALFTIMLWNRGVDRTWQERWYTIRQRLNGYAGLAWGMSFIICVLLFAFFQYGIHDNLICKAGYLTDAQKEAEAGAYEKKYADYRELVQPKITGLDLKLDLFPDQRKGMYEAFLILENKSQIPINTLHSNWDEKLIINNMVSEDNPIEMISNDTLLRHSIYSLKRPLEPGKTMKLTIKGTLAYKGFHQSDYQKDLTFNGTVLGVDLLPIFGYDRSRELDNNKKRLKQKLSMINSRMDDINNQFSMFNRFQSFQSDSLNWNIIVSTSADQTIIAPGKKLKSWKQDGRNCFHFQSSQSGLMNFKIISARLETKLFYCENIPCYLSYDPRHIYNLAVFQKALQQGMQWLSKKLGPYPYTCLQVVEKPFYGENFITFANVTAISEKYGWTADICQREDEQYIYKVIVREMAKHWIGERFKLADVQGAQLLTEGIAKYYALRFMDEKFGHLENVKWLNESYKEYQKGKGKEAIEEKNLLSVDKALYLSQAKGGLAFYAIAQRIGVQKFDQWLGWWLAKKNKKRTFLTSDNFYYDLKKEISGSLHPFVQEWLENRIQYRISLTNADLKDNRINLTISATKKYHHSKGVGKDPFSSLLEIGLIDENGELSSVNKLMIQSGTHTYRLDLDFKPATVVIDPYYWYLIENRQKSFMNL